jgi:hypothetical protein
VNQYNILYNNVPFGGKKQSGIGWLLLGTRNAGFNARLLYRARTWKLRFGRVYFRKSCAVEFWGEAGVAVVSIEYAMRGPASWKFLHVTKCLHFALLLSSLTRLISTR